MGHVEFSVFVGEPVTDVQYGVQVWGSISSEIFVESKFMCPTRREAKPKPGVGAEKGPLQGPYKENRAAHVQDLNSLKGLRERFKGKVREGNHRSRIYQCKVL